MMLISLQDFHGNGHLDLDNENRQWSPGLDKEINMATSRGAVLYIDCFSHNI